MAEEENKEAGQTGKGKTGLILVVVIFLVGIGAGFATAFLMMPEPVQEGPTLPVEIPDSLDGVPNIEKVTIKEIAVNPVGKRTRSNILAVSLAFDIKPKLTGPEEFESKRISIKDMIIVFLSSRKTEDLKNPKYKRVLKKELMNKINKQLENSKVTRVYFTQYIIQ